MSAAQAATAALAAVLRQTVVWENHCCLDFGDLPRWLPGLERYRRAGVNLVHVNVGGSDAGFEAAIRSAEFIRGWLHARPEAYVLARTVDDIACAKRDGRLAVCFDLEGAHVIGTDLDRVERFYGLGVRWMSLVYNRRNRAGAGCHDARDPGLTPFGRRLIAEMDRVGMVKDLAHTGDRTALEVCAASAKPVTISHSNPRALCEHPRCVPDELMRACARTGGVLGISGVGLFLGGNDPSTERIVRSIDYAVDVMGIDHVGIGTDVVFTTPGGLDPVLAGNRRLWPDGFGYESGIRFAQPEQFPEVADALLRLGYAQPDVGKILGGNFLRVAQTAWK